MAGAFRQLPFQFQQRADDLKRAVKADPDKYGQFTEQRDQDLENYLANLHGGAEVSLAAFLATTVDGGSTALTIGSHTPDYLGGFGANHLATDGTNNLIYTGDGDPANLLAITLTRITVYRDTGEPTGFIQWGVPAEGQSKLEYVDPGVAPALNLQVTTASNLASIQAGLTGAFQTQIAVAEVLTDLQTSGGTLGAPNALLFSSATLFVYLVE